jgi:hypothetical protein
VGKKKGKERERGGKEKKNRNTERKEKKGTKGKYGKVYSLLGTIAVRCYSV